MVLISICVSSDQRRMQLLKKFISAVAQSEPNLLHMHSNMAGYCLCLSTCIQKRDREIQSIDGQRERQNNTMT